MIENVSFLWSDGDSVLERLQHGYACKCKMDQMQEFHHHMASNGNNCSEVRKSRFNDTVSLSGKNTLNFALSTKILLLFYTKLHFWELPNKEVGIRELLESLWAQTFSALVASCFWSFIFMSSVSWLKAYPHIWRTPTYIFIRCSLVVWIKYSHKELWETCRLLSQSVDVSKWSWPATFLDLATTC